MILFWIKVVILVMGVSIKGWFSDNKGKLEKLKDDENILYMEYEF